jgi:hypothetical protein
LKIASTTLIALALAGCANLGPQSPTPTILVDLDPASAERTVIIESITANRDGLLYVADRVSGNVMLIDPKKPQPVIVGRVGSRQVNGQMTAPNPSGMVFNSQGTCRSAPPPLAKLCACAAPSLTRPAPVWPRPS